MVHELQDRIERAAFAFRGYNVTNLGRSDELLAHRAYGPLVHKYLEEAGEICGEVIGRRVRLVERVKQRHETTLRSYSEAIALVVGMELAQIELLRQFHGVEFSQAKLAFGYSLGELAALCCAGTLTLRDALTTPLAMSGDCAELAADVRMGVVFSRGPALPLSEITRLCLEINQAGQGVIGVSAILSPNTVLLLGQGDTLRRFEARMPETLPARTHLRMNPNHWPPLHTPIMWQRQIPNRAAQMLHTLEGGFTPPRPPIVSLVTGKACYNDHNTRELLHRWVDHPQRLWDVVYETLAAGVETVVHVGPEPNLIFATFKRLSDNVQAQVGSGPWGAWRLRAVSGMMRRQWLAALLPSRTALLRAPLVRHIILEDWLLDQLVP